MSGSKVYVKKPLRRYERAFDEQKVDGEDLEKAPEETGTEIPAVVPDITSPPGHSPLLKVKKPPMQFRVRAAAAKKSHAEQSQESDPIKKSPPR